MICQRENEFLGLFEERKLIAHQNHDAANLYFHPYTGANSFKLHNGICCFQIYANLIDGKFIV